MNRLATIALLVLAAALPGYAADEKTDAKQEQAEKPAPLPPHVAKILKYLPMPKDGWTKESCLAANEWLAEYVTKNRMVIGAKIDTQGGTSNREVRFRFSGNSSNKLDYIEIVAVVSTEQAELFEPGQDVKISGKVADARVIASPTAITKLYLVLRDIELPAKK